MSPGEPFPPEMMQTTLCSIRSPCRYLFPVVLRRAELLCHLQFPSSRVFPGPLTSLTCSPPTGLLFHAGPAGASFVPCQIVSASPGQLLLVCPHGLLLWLATWIFDTFFLGGARCCCSCISEPLTLRSPRVNTLRLQGRPGT